MHRTQLTIAWVLLGISLIAVCLPRFNRNDPGVVGQYTANGARSKVNPDSSNYAAYIDYFRGHQVPIVLEAPYTYRPAAPFLASLLPFPPATSLNILNILSLLVALWFLAKILAHLGLAACYRLLGGALFVFSFPTFYYGAITYIDPMMICFLMMGTYCILVERWGALALTLAVGALVKDTVFLLFPVLLTHLFCMKRPLWKSGLLFLGLAVAYLVPVVAIRFFTPGAHGYLWWPSGSNVAFNIHGIRVWISFTLSFGIPGFVSLAVIPYLGKSSLTQARKLYAPLIVGMIMSLVIFAYSLTSAYADGRYIWIAMPFSIPLAVYGFSRLRGERSIHDAPSNTRLRQPAIE